MCDLPKALRTWGWSVQLYALRSALSWGIGDLADLRRLAHWSASELNAGILLVNPLHAATPVVPQQPSPYFPSSRRYRNLLYLRIEDIPGAAEARLDLERLAVAGRVLNRERRIDRDAVFKLKIEALQVLWSRFGGVLPLIGTAMKKARPLSSLPPSVPLLRTMVAAGTTGRPSTSTRTRLG